ncbi:MAG TPA: AtpZ/AtpI family protein [Leptospiraceae bacterium]|nr:AtpZ/AtpI family protein [Leptospiraceae bacterium]HMZ57978.1 AtpZ/AtpI family protein [Leptospiraceae bacterium]HNF14760.1 AtpZ/AtpI family protein [Leptospiraceae bacterium]HNF25589.1 AtpZ/AtpI family protein [Leptospiraceae bacterium]HNH09267.1 AtpZ/AtpI family protein [Leptospiraceae bacterium]
MKPQNPPPMSIWNLSSLGTEFGIIIVGFILAGSWLEERFSFSPWGVMVGALLGFGIGIFHLVKRTDEFNRSNEKKKDPSDSAP